MSVSHHVNGMWNPFFVQFPVFLRVFHVAFSTDTHLHAILTFLSLYRHTQGLLQTISFLQQEWISYEVLCKQYLEDCIVVNEQLPNGMH